MQTMPFQAIIRVFRNSFVPEKMQKTLQSPESMPRYFWESSLAFILQKIFSNSDLLSQQYICLFLIPSPFQRSHLLFCALCSRRQCSTSDSGRPGRLRCFQQSGDWRSRDRCKVKRRHHPWNSFGVGPGHGESRALSVLFKKWEWYWRGEARWKAKCIPLYIDLV